jgi:hypothetical protein
LSSEDSTLTGGGYIIDSDSDTDVLVNTGEYVGGDDISPLAHGEIEDDSRPLAGTHYVMASHSGASETRVNEGRNRRTASGRIITHAQIRHARRVYMGEIPLDPNPGEDELASLSLSSTSQKPS